AQEGGAGKERRVKLMEGAGEGERVNTEVAAAFFGLGEERTTGAPFAAQVVIENTQTLANGSHIVDKQTGAVYRDSEGRLRREMPRKGEHEIVVISDPVAAVNYRLHMFQQTVVKYHLEPLTPGAGAERKVREMAEHREAEEREMKARANAAAGGSPR